MNKIVALLFVGTVGFGLLSLHLVRELRAERSRSSLLKTEFDRVLAGPAAYKNEQLEQSAPGESAPSAEQSVQGSVQPQVVLPWAGIVHSPVIVGSMAMSGEAREERMKQMREMRERQKALMQDPAYRAAFLAQQKHGQRMSQPGLKRELGLSDEQFDQLLDVLVEQQLRAIELGEQYGYSEPMDAAAMQEQSRKYQEQFQQNQRELAAMLGEGKYRSYQEFQMTGGARHEVMQLKLTLADAGAPLREDQVQPLVRAIHQSNMQLSQNMIPARQGRAPTQEEFQKHQLEVMRQQKKRVIDAAARVLTEDQLDAFTQQQEQQLEMQEIQLRMMQAQADAVARGDVPPMSSPLGANVFYEGNSVVFSSAAPPPQ